MKDKSKIKIGSNRSFGLFFFIILMIIGLWPLKNNGDLNLYAVLLSMPFLILGLLNSKLLSPLNFLWFKFGIAIGSIMAPIVMGVVFFFIVTPTGIIMKIFGKKMLDNAFDKGKKSYWINRDKQAHSMRKQF
jgi:polyferredoxin|tara:strand:- start:24 stop:419 length:396 start_codon:yes stop_codon:yes gene_type:complete